MQLASTPRPIGRAAALPLSGDVHFTSAPCRPLAQSGMGGVPAGSFHKKPHSR